MREDGEEDREPRRSELRMVYSETKAAAGALIEILLLPSPSVAIARDRG